MTFINAIRSSDSPSIDSFGRWRTSNSRTLFYSKQEYDSTPLLWDDVEISGFGTTSVHSTDTASQTLGVSGTTEGRRIRQTFMRFNYEPGQSQLVFMTTILDQFGGGTGIFRKVGLFDDDNGYFLQDAEGVIEFVRRKDVTGSPVDERIEQSNWNLDKMDGTGPSGVTLDFSKVQLLLIDGVGRVRLGFSVAGKINYAHEFLHSNVSDVTYLPLPSLPLRYEIENDGTGVESTFSQNCVAVTSEGGDRLSGVLRYKSTSGVPVVAAVVGVLYAIIGIRIKSDHIGIEVRLMSSSLLEIVGDKNLEWILVRNSTIAGSPVWVDEMNGGVQTLVGSGLNTLTGGVIITGGYFSSDKKGGSEGAMLSNALLLGAAIDGTVDEIVLAVRPVAGSMNSQVEGSLSWRERP